LIHTSKSITGKFCRCNLPLYKWLKGLQKVFYLFLYAPAQCHAPMSAASVRTCHISLLASLSCMHLATSMCHIFHSLTTYISHCRANVVYWGLEGCPKAGNTGGMPWFDQRFHMLGLPVKNLTPLKFQTFKFYFCISWIHMKYTKICSKISHYTEDATHVFNQLFILFIMQAGGGLGARLTS